jgi:hypothetical protein
LIQELKRKLKNNKGKALSPISGDDFKITPEIETFENFQDKAGKMMY